MTFILATTARDAACDAIVDLIDTGAGANGIIDIRTGTQPANPQTAATGTLLATLNFSATAFGASSSGTATAAAIASDTNVDNTGTAGWARVYDKDGSGSDPANSVFDMDIGQGSGTLSFDNTSFVAGGTASISSMTVTVPAS